MQLEGGDGRSYVCGIKIAGVIKLRLAALSIDLHCNNYTRNARAQKNKKL